MARAPDPNIRLWWRRLIDDFDPQRFTVAEFCRKHRVSQPSFYKWRRKLAGEMAPRGAQSERRNGKPSHTPPAFVPLQLVHNSHGALAQAVQVHLPSGIRVDVPAGRKDLLWELLEHLGHTKEGQA